MKTTTRRAKPQPAKRPKSSSSARRGAANRTPDRKPAAPAKRAAPAAERAAPAAKRTGPAAKRAAAAAKRAGPAARRAATRAKRTATKQPARRAARTAAPRARAASANRWLTFVEQHGVVLASARGPVPSVAEAVAGQPIIGSWWAHPKGKAIFSALSDLDDSEDVRCFKLIDGKVTFVHRRVWPALTRLASEGVIAAGRVASIQQEHMPTGEHRNLITPFPDWVPDEVARAASALTLDDARAQLGTWV